MLSRILTDDFEAAKKDPRGGITYRQCGLEIRQPKRAYLVNGHGTNTRYGMHATSFNNIQKGLLTRLFTVKYKAEILAARLQRDLDVVKNHEAHHRSLDAKRGEKCALSHYQCKNLQRLAVTVEDATKVGRGQPFPPRLGFYESKEIIRLRNKVIRSCPKFTPEDREDFPRYYRGRRRAVYENAVESLKVSRVKEEDAWIKAFTKAEKLNFTAKPDPDPRMIQPRTPRYNVEVGRFIKQMEHSLCHGVGLALFNHPTITKGMNAGQTGSLIAEKWSMFKDPVAVGLDAARFDQHVSVDALRFEHEFYLGLLHTERDRRKLRRLLSWQLRNIGRCWIDGTRIKYVSHGARMSGDMNTGLGNCIIASTIVKLYLDYKGVRGQLVNNGDDCVVFMEREDLQKFSEGALEFFSDGGFTMEIEEPVYELEKVVFCQAQPVYDGISYRMVRDPRTSLSKDAVSLLKIDDDVSQATWLDAVGQCGLAMAGDMPILGAYYQSMVTSAAAIATRRNKIGSHDLMDTGMSRLSEGMHHRFSKPTDEARESFYNAFGILPDVQEAFENFYISKRINPGVVLGTGGVSLHANQFSHDGRLA